MDLRTSVRKQFGYRISSETTGRIFSKIVWDVPLMT